MKLRLKWPTDAGVYSVEEAVIYGLTDGLSRGELETLRNELSSSREFLSSLTAMLLANKALSKQNILDLLSAFEEAS